MELGICAMVKLTLTIQVSSHGKARSIVKKGVAKFSVDANMYMKAQKMSSSTKWLILVDTKSCKVGIFKGGRGNWDLQKYWSCSPGASATPTVKGTFTVQSKGLAFGSGYTCWYYTQFYGNYLFHSVLYNPGSKTSLQDGRLGMQLYMAV